VRAVFVNVISWIVMLACLGSAGTASAQTAPAPPLTEEVEPRVVGRQGMTSIGVAGFVDRVYSPEEIFTTNYTVHVDGARFITKRFAIRLGVAGTGAFGGDEDDDEPAGPGAPALHGSGGLLFYFTPDSMLSLYLGTEYSMQITRRSESDRGAVLGKAGIQGALSSRASFFIEGGFGAGVTRGSEGELLTRFVGQVGIRIKL
jgi:hypothetical protein